jgi:hypothetical protein
MRREERPPQTLAHPSPIAQSDRGTCCGNYVNSNRHTSELKPLVTYSKQTAATRSNRHNFGGTLYPRAGSLCKEEGGNFLTLARPMLYISRVLEETGGPLPASYRLGYRGTGLVGAGIGNGFEDSSYSSVQILFLKIFAGVSLPGIFAFAHFCGRTARPHTEEAA